MPGKSSSKNANPQSVKRKTGRKKVGLIIAAIILLLGFLLFSIYNPYANKIKTVSRINQPKSPPTFRKDTQISILKSGSGSPILLDIEIADDEAERTRGLMDRLSMPELAGMFFIFEDDQQRSFWMKNTYISLDIIYINSNKEIVSIQKYTQPQTTSSIPSEKPAKYVLEVNAGFTDKYGINPGDKIELYF
jgi:uncharacterized protein